MIGVLQKSETFIRIEYIDLFYGSGGISRGFIRKVKYFFKNRDFCKMA